MTVVAEQRVVGRDWRGGTLHDVIDVILDKGMVIDVYLRVSLLGVELITVDARIVVASIDTYLRFAEKVNRIDLSQTKDGRTLPESFGTLYRQGGGPSGTRSTATRGLLRGAAAAFSDALHHASHHASHRAGGAREDDR